MAPNHPLNDFRASWRLATHPWEGQRSGFRGPGSSYLCPPRAGRSGGGVLAILTGPLVPPKSLQGLRGDMSDRGARGHSKGPSPCFPVITCQGDRPGSSLPRPRRVRRGTGHVSSSTGLPATRVLATPGAPGAVEGPDREELARVRVRGSRTEVAVEISPRWFDRYPRAPSTPLDGAFESPAGGLLLLSDSPIIHVLMNPKGPNQPEKKCSICGKPFPLSEFTYRNRKNRSYCRECDREEMAARRRGGIEAAGEYRKNKRAEWEK